MEDENKEDKPRVQAEDNSVAIGAFNVGGNVEGQVNIAGGNIVNTTVIINAPSEAVSGLTALRDMMQRSSDVRTAVISFQTDFKVVCEQVDRLGDYKDLHDILHRLQLQCYNGIAQAETRFPNDEWTIDNLIQHALTLEGFHEQLKQFATRPSMPKHELGWIDDIGLAKADLSNAIELRDGKLLKKVIWRLNNILATWPARINILLNHSARTLRLPTLLSALGIVCKKFVSLDLDMNKVTAFQSGVNALGVLDQELSSLVEDHDHWQALDVELRRIEGLLDHDLKDLDWSWPAVKEMAEPLYSTRPDEWARSLKKESDRLDEALIESNPAKVRRSFSNYHHRVAHRFFIVDLNLKGLCGDMRKIGIPLTSVLEMIQ